MTISNTWLQVFKKKLNLRTNAPYTMKNRIKAFLQNVFGFKTYLLIFSLYCIRKALKGHYEREFAHFIDLIPAEGIILDVGANIGITAIPLARFREKATVHAYEPISENFYTLQRVTKLYHLNNINLFNEALGNGSGSLKMIMPVKGKARQQGLSKVVDGPNYNGVLYEVPVRRLDDIYTNHEHISAIKIDVENFEFEVLSGAKHLLSRCMPIIYCELWDNEKRSSVFDYLSSLGYGAYIFDHQGGKLDAINIPYSGASSNFFFLPN